MRVDRAVSLLAVTMALGVASGCYHAVIETGLQPGPVGYYEEWETAWLIGAVPARVDAAEACDGPWARIDTQQSFLNGVVTFLTLGIYAPHEVEVTCAALPARPARQRPGSGETR